MNAKITAVALLLACIVTAPAEAVVIQQLYQINPGGIYQYFPFPFGGIPGGMPNNYQLDFGIGGTFVYEYESDFTGETARLLNLDLVLTGNEAIQAAPPPVAPVTAERVEDYLASHTFVTDFIGGLIHLESSTHPNLKLTDAVTGNIMIFGGYNNRPVDGDGMHFQFSAHAIPEPAALALAAVALGILFSRRSR